MYTTMVIYYLITAFFGGIFFWKFVRERDLQKAILCLIVLMPFVLRVFRIK